MQKKKTNNFQNMICHPSSLQSHLSMVLKLRIKYVGSRFSTIYLEGEVLD